MRLGLPPAPPKSFNNNNNNQKRKDSNHIVRNLLPRSPCWAYFVLVYSPPLKTGTGEPPAMPHGSLTGASPGDRHGW